MALHLQARNRAWYILGGSRICKTGTFPNFIPGDTDTHTQKKSERKKPYAILKPNSISQTKSFLLDSIVCTVYSDLGDSKAGESTPPHLSPKA